MARCGQLFLARYGAPSAGARAFAAKQAAGFSPLFYSIIFLRARFTSAVDRRADMIPRQRNDAPELDQEDEEKGERQEEKGSRGGTWREAARAF